MAELAVEYVTAKELRVIAEFAGGRRWTDLGWAALHQDCRKRLQSVPAERGGRRRWP
ncbi:hypothetical protein [Streptomyces sp. 1222.5]|uniref:hypothetical protein n=1 Tax=Streptomyces sp. 1222.5 TaxID=1881026 RepID=UPI003D73B3DD